MTRRKKSQRKKEILNDRKKKKKFGNLPGHELRAIAAMNLPRYYLIACEGKKTEPLYFEGLKKSLRKDVFQTCIIDIVGLGFNTKALVKEAEALRKDQQLEWQVTDTWVVFDRDSFPKEHFNGAIIQAESNNIHCAWSNEAFELWFLLHFEYYNAPISRDKYRGLIESRLRRSLGKSYTYRKNDSRMFELLTKHGSIDNAVKNAQRLIATYGDRTDYADHNPCTRVHVLVEELLSLQEGQQGAATVIINSQPSA